MFLLFLVRLAESERRYRSRESRPDDLEAIRELKLTVQEQERKMKELIVSPSNAISSIKIVTISKKSIVNHLQIY